MQDFLYKWVLCKMQWGETLQQPDNWIVFNATDEFDIDNVSVT